MEYEIIATLGPSSTDEAQWAAMAAAGVNAFRLNTSHLTLEALDSWLERLSSYFTDGGSRLPVVLDLQGSKWRLGVFTVFELRPGETVELVHAASTNQPLRLPVPHRDFFRAAPLSGDELVLDDARVRLRIESIQPESIRAQVLQGGEISSRKGITFQQSGFRKEALSEKDAAILERTRELYFLRYAISYVKDAAEMRRYREIFGSTAYLIAKIERHPAIEQGAEIAEYSNELWLCRGDLGAELGLQAMAQAVHEFSSLPKRFPIPALMAGQVLEHMTLQPEPTRSEVCYLYDLLQRGYRGVVLSDETAIGRHPLESCKAAAMFKNETQDPLGL